MKTQANYEATRVDARTKYRPAAGRPVPHDVAIRGPTGPAPTLPAEPTGPILVLRSATNHGKQEPSFSQAGLCCPRRAEGTHAAPALTPYQSRPKCPSHTPQSWSRIPFGSSRPIDAGRLPFAQAPAPSRHGLSTSRSAYKQIEMAASNYTLNIAARVSAARSSS